MFGGFEGLEEKLKGELGDLQEKVEEIKEEESSEEYKQVLCKVHKLMSELAQDCLEPAEYEYIMHCVKHKVTTMRLRALKLGILLMETKPDFVKEILRECLDQDAKVVLGNLINFNVRKMRSEG